MIYFVPDCISNWRFLKNITLERIKEVKFQKSAPQKQINSSLQNTELQIAQKLPDDICKNSSTICSYTVQR
jgi:hypothetical protein